MNLAVSITKDLISVLQKWAVEMNTSLEVVEAKGKQFDQ
jgi:hypothetical protein